MTRLRLGACLSLTGRYGRFGRQAAHGLQAWQRLVGDEVDVEIEDDGSDPALFATRLWSMASRSDLLHGPYSTQLMREAAGAMARSTACSGIRAAPGMTCRRCARAGWSRCSLRRVGMRFLSCAREPRNKS